MPPSAITVAMMLAPGGALSAGAGSWPVTPAGTTVAAFAAVNSAASSTSPGTLSSMVGPSAAVAPMPSLRHGREQRDARVLFDNTPEPLRERALAERRKALGAKERTPGLAKRVDLPRRQAVQVLTQIRVVGELPFVDQAVGRNPAFVVRSPPVNRNGPGHEAVEDLLGNQALELHVVVHQAVRVLGERLDLRGNRPLVHLAGRFQHRGRMDLLPSIPEESLDSLDRRRLPGPAHLVRHLVPALAEQIDLPVSRKELDGRRPLRIELLPAQRRHLVVVDHDEEPPVAAPPEV